MQLNPNPPELIILKSLWSHGPLPVKQIHTLCENKLNWSFSSTRKTVSRMVDKNLVVLNAEEGIATYSARTSKTTTLSSLTRDFMYRVLEIDGPIPSSIYNNSKLLSDDDLDEMDGLI